MNQFPRSPTYFVFLLDTGETTAIVPAETSVRTIFYRDCLSNQGEMNIPLIMIIVATLVFCANIAVAVQLPFLSNITLVPKSTSASVILTDRSCDDCLCEANFYSILNCFPNNTCQFFVDAPRAYTLKPTPNALLYFPRQIVPNASQCCVPKRNQLVKRLENLALISSPVNGSRCLALDNHGYLVTVSHTDQTIVRFYANNLTQVDQSPPSLFSDSPLALTYHNEAYYVGFDYYILVVDSNNMTLMHNISTSALNGTRDIMFLNKGQQMIVTATYSNRLVFFNRSSLTSHNYDYMGYQDVSCPGPHGLSYVDDGLFYVTSFYNSTVYKYSASENGTAWNETLAVTPSPVASSSGNHVTMDGCDRYWLSLGAGGVQVFDRAGLLVNLILPTGSNIFDALVLDNYVIYLSDNGGNTILRLDPNIHC